MYQRKNWTIVTNLLIILFALSRAMPRHMKPKIESWRKVAD
jgi:uncharacterized membrane protein